MNPDSELIARSLTESDTTAFGELVKRYQSTIRQFLRRLTAGDHALADDIAQDTFITAFQKLGQFKGTGSFKSWLHTLAYRRFLRVIQTGANKYETPCDVSWQQLTTHDAVEADILAEKLMSHLDLNERTALTLNCSEGLSHQEIAQITGIPLGTVKSYIARAKSKLNTLLSSQALQAS